MHQRHQASPLSISSDPLPSRSLLSPVTRFPSTPSSCFHLMSFHFLHLHRTYAQTVFRWLPHGPTLSNGPPCLGRLVTVVLSQTQTPQFRPHASLPNAHVAFPPCPKISDHLGCCVLRTSPWTMARSGPSIFPVRAFFPSGREFDLAVVTCPASKIIVQRRKECQGQSSQFQRNIPTWSPYVTTRGPFSPISGCRGEILDQSYSGIPSSGPIQSSICICSGQRAIRSH